MITTRVAALGAGLCLTLGLPGPVGAVPGPEPVRFSDPDIIEASGLVTTGPEFLTTNDSGDSGRVFIVDASTGKTVGTTRWDDEPTDVEALAPDQVGGPGRVWVGDIGDNKAERKSIEVTSIPWARDNLQVDEETIDLVYPDGPRDAEALLAHPWTGQLFVASKGLLGGTLYAAPRRLADDDPNRLVAMQSVPGLITDGAFWPDGKHLVLRNYQRAYVYEFPSLRQMGDFLLPEQKQGEAIAVDPRGRLWVTSEGVNQQILRVRLPRSIRQAMTGGASASPAALTREVTATGEAAGEAGESPEARLGGARRWRWIAGAVVFVGLGIAGFVARRRGASHLNQR